MDDSKTPADDPWTLPNGLTYVQNELWDTDRLKLAIQMSPPPEEAPPPSKVGIGPIDESQLPQMSWESGGEHEAILMLAQHPMLHNENSPERVLTEQVNRLLETAYTRGAEEACSNDEKAMVFDDIVDMLVDASVPIKEDDEGVVDMRDLLSKIHHIINMAASAGARLESPERRLDRIEAKVAALEDLTAVPERVGGMSEAKVRAIDHKGWLAEGAKLFGKDMANWVFVCPVCEHEASCADFEKLGGKHDDAAQECMGRRLPEEKRRDALGGTGQGPCNYAGYGLFQFSPVTIRMKEGDELRSFEFGKPR